MSCTILDNSMLKMGYKKLEKANNELAQVKAESEKKIKVAEDKVSKEKDNYYNQILSNYQTASNWSYGTWITAQLNKKTYPSRMADVLFLKADSTLKFSLQPTVAAIMEQNKSLLDELDEQKVSNQQLQEKYNKVAQDAQKAREQLKQKESDLQSAEKEKQNIKEQTDKEIKDAQDKADKEKDKVLQLQNKKIENDKILESIKHKIEYILMGLSVLFILGVVYGPISFKLESGIGAVVSIALALLVSYIELWMIFTGLGIVVVLIGLSIYLKHNNETKLANNTVGAIQEVRNESEEVYQKTIKPKLEDWFKDAPNLVKKVDGKLKQLNLK